MSILDQPPKLINANWQQWSQRVSTWLAQTRSALRHKVTGESAAEDGVLLWDREHSEPVISIDGRYVPLVIEGGYGAFIRTTDVIPSAINTAEVVTLDSNGFSDRIDFGTPSSRIVFEDAGIYTLSFSAQLTSLNGTVKTVWFWPRINGTDSENSTVKVSIKDNATTTVVSRTQVFQVSANDYLEIFWATDNLHLKLEAAPATAFAPAAPSVILTVARVRQV